MKSSMIKKEKRTRRHKKIRVKVFGTAVRPRLSVFRSSNHIYAQIGLPRRAPSKWISFDASVAVPFGWEPPKSMIAKARTFNI